MINGRAAVRTEIGGVERLASEMQARLPRLSPGRYRVIEPPRGFAHRAGHAWEQAILPRRAAGCQLIYSPANLAPVASRRNVVVIHDAAALRHPEAYSRTYVTYQRLLLPQLARRARLLITVSEFSKRELVDLLGARPESIEVIPGGVGERFHARVDPGPAEHVLGLRKPYVLAVGTVSARKNLDTLGRTERALREKGIELVVAGSDRDYLRPVSVPARRLGFVPDPLLPSLYAGARAVVLPSRYEGFGLPCLEAMACGVPVVCSPFGALPETCGDGALVVDPADEIQFAEAVLSAACHEPTRGRLSVAGLARAARYSWERTAELTDRAIERLLREA
ncbi:MAG: glycosyltransferase family 4 protein [Solirubrobacteraceae bacterium]